MSSSTANEDDGGKAAVKVSDLDAMKNALEVLTGDGECDTETMLGALRRFQERDLAIKASRQRYNNARKKYHFREAHGSDRSLIVAIIGYLQDRIYPNTYFLNQQWWLWHSRDLGNTLCNVLMDMVVQKFEKPDTYETWRDVCVIVRKNVRDTKNNFISKAKKRLLGNHSSICILFYIINT